MSKDSSATYIHLRSSSHADLFEEFCRPPSSIPTTSASTHPNTSSAQQSQQQQAANAAASSDPSSTSLPGHYLPFDDIHLPEHLMPSNPEDEDDVVPQGHAAWGIVRAMQMHTQQQQASGGGSGDGSGAPGAGAGEAPVERWRDLGLESLMRRAEAGGRREGGANGVGGTTGAGMLGGLRGAGTGESSRRWRLLLR